MEAKNICAHRKKTHLPQEVHCVNWPIQTSIAGIIGGALGQESPLMETETPDGKLINVVSQ